ncbi:MAG: YccF domain-containing protein [Propionivibrio sp.]
MSTIGNIFWFVFGGAVMGLGWWLAGLLCFLSIIGIPWGRACFVIGGFAFFPFGRDAVDREDLTRRGDLGTGTLGFLGNVIWFVVVGVWLAIGHLVSALACFVTIIGIPFGLQHLKLAVLTLAPVGKTIVDKEVAAAVRGEAAQDALNKYRS